MILRSIEGLSREQLGKGGPSKGHFFLIRSQDILLTVSLALRTMPP